MRRTSLASRAFRPLLWPWLVGQRFSPSSNGATFRDDCLRLSAQELRFILSTTFPGVPGTLESRQSTGSTKQRTKGSSITVRVHNAYTPCAWLQPTQ
jgi:hypothetical protein